MGYRCVIDPDAAADLKALDSQSEERIVEKLFWIFRQQNPLRFAVRLVDKREGDFRFRIGDYRAIGFVNEKSKEIRIVAIGHRREIYR